MTPIINLNVYVIHVESFKLRKNTCERLKQLLEQSPKLKVQFTYITSHDPSSITQDTIKQTVDYQKITDEKLLPFNSLIRNMHINQLSNCLKHKEAIELISKSQDGDFNIVLEDDVVYNDNIGTSLYEVLSNMPDNTEVMFLGLPSSKDQSQSYQDLKRIFKVVPCCDSYFVSKQTAQLMTQNYSPIKFANNIQLSYLFEKLNLNAKLSNPNVFIDGSKLGLYFSTLEVNNRLIFNEDYVQLLRLLTQKDTFTPEDKNTINRLFTEVKLKTNPEFYYLKALWEYKQGHYEFSKAIYQYAYDLYESNGVLLNNQSSFMRDYLRVFRHLQETV